ncbi:MAG: RNA polymerase subunit sigma-70 [Fluviicola sp. XM-24bin1]|nr:MAG: RNA polymerase subunit sigma-70 [Fluviicola sp. XM-24bin1]
MTDRQQKILLKGCRNGKPAAQKELYDRFASDMFKVCLMYSKDYDGASDLLQEGFLRVFQKIHLFKAKDHGSLGGWIRTVIVHNCVDHYRSDSWSKNKLELTDEETERAQYRNHEEDEEETIYDRDEFLKIIAQLPDGYALVLNLFYMEGYTHKEIAAKLEITEGTSKSQLFKAKKYLRNLLLENLGEDEIGRYEGFGRKVV